MTKISGGGRSGGIVASCRTRLEAAGRLDTMEAALVLELAEAIARGGHSAAGYATLSRELRAAMTLAMGGVDRPGGGGSDRGAAVRARLREA